MAFLLDTNIMADLLRFPFGRVAAELAKVGEASVFTSIVVASELRYGVAKRGSARLGGLVDALLRKIRVADLGEPADRHFAALRVHLERRGSPIGSNDLLIAAHAQATGSVLVTNNVREFSRVPNLRLENWLSA